MRRPQRVPHPWKRFWSKVKPNEQNGCWEWQAHRLRAGYGHVGVRTRLYLAHRLAWLMTRGPIPKGIFVCHTCDNPPCVRPSHLFLGTNLDNMRDAKAKGRNRPPPPRTIVYIPRTEQACKDCGVVKPMEEFRRDHTMASDRSNQCKTCHLPVKQRYRRRAKIRDLARKLAQDLINREGTNVVNTTGPARTV